MRAQPNTQVAHADSSVASARTELSTTPFPMRLKIEI
jgi:hypothetical protein